MTNGQWNTYYRILAKRNNGEAISEKEIDKFVRLKAIIRRAEKNTHWDFQKLKQMRSYES